MPRHYRVGEYLLSDIGGTDIRWEAHSGFAASQKGRCHILGDVLFIGPPLEKETGAFKGDFLDSLKPLPAWSRTNLYCVNARLYRCGDGHHLAWDEVAALSASSYAIGRSVGKASMSSGDPPEGNFRMGRYEIIHEGDGFLHWRGRTSSRNIVEGEAFIIGDFLFLGVGQQKAQLRAREEFGQRLTQLPPWRATSYFITNATIRECGKNPEPFNEQRHPVAPRVKERVHNSAAIGQEYTKDLSQLLLRATTEIWRVSVRLWGWLRKRKLARRLRSFLSQGFRMLLGLVKAYLARRHG